MIIKKKYLINIMLILILLASFFLSLWQSAYTFDPLHWGLMLSNAKDLNSGLLPYKDIFIQYGYLTTLIHSAAYMFLGENIFSIIFITSLFYSIGLLVMFMISNVITKKVEISLCIVFTSFLIHPIVIYPWSNYLAFPLLMLGILFGLDHKDQNKWKLLSGFLMGLAILTREGLFPSVIAIVIVNFIIKLISTKNITFAIKELIFYLTGIFLPILFFLILINKLGVIDYWFDLSFKLPKIYAEMLFPHMKNFNFIKPWTYINVFTLLAEKIVQGITDLDIRWFLVLAIIVGNIYTIIKTLFSKNRDYNLLKIASSSLLLITSTAHLPEIFRFSTASIIGIINLFYFISKFRFFKFLFLVISLLLIISMFPKDSGKNFNTTNYFYPDSSAIDDVVKILDLSIYKNQKWLLKNSIYYSEVNDDFLKIKEKCGIKYIVNDSFDVFIYALSPFVKHQLAPFKFHKNFEGLRPDLDVERKISKNQSDLIIFSSDTQSDTFKLGQNNLKLYKKYNVSNQSFAISGLSSNSNESYLFIPDECFNKINNLY